ncbi:NAD(P)/FAD-dependent oxidoreductase [Rhodococcus opacus]|nr:NAD(P)/FAD-dependent oxidoreductase [Rhodococcus opacus]
MTQTLGALPVEESTPVDAAHVVADWLARFQTALVAHDANALTGLFAEGSTFRDLLVFEWDFLNFVGARDIGEGLAKLSTSREIRRPFTIRPDKEIAIQEAVEGEHLLAFIGFATEIGSCDGFLRLRRDPSGQVAALGLVVELIELDGFPEAVGEHRPDGRTHGASMGRRTWGDEHDTEFPSGDPQAVIVGGGHSGLIQAARLIRLGVSTLVLERNARVGDNWRNRYSSLALHDPYEVAQLPYFPVPEGWPRFAPKDKFADLLEAYATLMDVPVWTSATVGNVHYDEAASQWVCDVDRPGKPRRTLRSGHLIMATGANTVPVLPKIPGTDRFRGDIVHSSAYAGGESSMPSTALVVGVGTSGHDVAQDLAEHGVGVTLLQRSPSLIVNIGTIHALNYAPWLTMSLSTEDADLMGAETPFGVYPSLGKDWMDVAKGMDKNLHAALEDAGFELGWGPDGSGLLGLVFGANKFSYYYNVGASDLIVQGKIRIDQGAIERFTETGVVLDDGTAIDADLVVFATGYQKPRESNRSVLGDVVDELPEINKVGPDGELSAVWRHCGKDRLWFSTATGILYSRFYSKLLALQIKAIEEGLMPASGPASS